MAQAQAPSEREGNQLVYRILLDMRDGIDAAARVGITAVIQPGGSVRDAEVIAAADWVVDMGPEAGDGGGRIVVAGPPEDVAIHAARWRAAEDRRGGRSPATDTDLLRSHTGEALERFGRDRG